MDEIPLIVGEGVPFDEVLRKYCCRMPFKLRVIYDVIFMVAERWRETERERERESDREIPRIDTARP